MPKGRESNDITPHPQLIDWASYQLVWLAYTEAAYYVKLYDSFSVKVLDQVTKVPKLSSSKLYLSYT